MKICKTMGRIFLLGTGWMLNNFYHASQVQLTSYRPPRRYSAYYTGVRDNYSIRRTIRKIICQKLESWSNNEPKSRFACLHQDDRIPRFIVSTRVKAEDAICEIEKVMDTYGRVRVDDVARVCEISIEWQDYFYGWTTWAEIRSFHIRRLRANKWCIDTPTPKRLVD